MYKIGIDIGSTTVKLVVVDKQGRPLHHTYERHNAKIKETLCRSLDQARQVVGNNEIALRFTGSVGQGVAEQFGLPFIQEVVAISIYARRACPDVHTLIDIGGEDAKMVFLRPGQAPDLRMNGNCAGGTGAFIDQMALLLHISAAELSRLALQASHVYPIASRCGVFSKTDIQNLLSKNASKADVAASILHAIAVQTVTTLSHGMTLQAPILLCGGPFTFLPALRKAFADYLQIPEDNFILPENSHMLPAIGAAWNEGGNDIPQTLDTFMEQLQTAPIKQSVNTLPPVFFDKNEHALWLESKRLYTLPMGQLHAGEVHAFLGIDSGSTTTKIVLIEVASGRVLFTHYCPNEGDPIQAVRNGLALLQARCDEYAADLFIDGTCSTGYGEDLIKAAFNLGNGIVETIAHFHAARHLNPQVSFILDIGGQDMKAVFIDNSTINRIEINEACSSGCGSFIATFARSLGHSADEFDHLACTATRPADLGTRCTVFMNSKVKEALREGLSVADIAAGLSYSVVKNCLYKVLKLQNIQELGEHIVVQGGTMRNDSVVRAFEQLTGREVIRGSHPELMGAYGCALYAAEHVTRVSIRLSDLLSAACYDTKKSYCKGCENSCLVEHYTFANGSRFVAGNKCERIFSNKGEHHTSGTNLYELKNQLLFDRDVPDACQGLRIGIPRCLNMYENYPFWHTLLVSCGLRPILSAPSAWQPYERTAHYVMSDNICFPAKIVHSHIADLERQKVDRILMPYVMHEKQHKGEANSYNCPIVTGYGEVIRNVMPLSVPFDEPVISFKDTHRLIAQCTDYLLGIGIPKNKITSAVKAALAAQERFEIDIASANKALFKSARQSGRLTVLLAGRPYHTDMLIQHKLAEMIAAMGIDVLTDDMVRDDVLDKAHFVGQWSFPNRILKAAQWVSWQDADVQFVQMTSFGCGPDAFLLDEVKSVLKQGGKALTLLKIDDINNIGAMRLRIRSLVESIRMNRTVGLVRHASVRTPVFTQEDKRRKILMPFFTPFISPLLPALFSLSGYDAESLPMSDRQSVDYGLQYANNEICYPATLVVGDIVRAFKSGRYDPDRTAVAFVQTGGQCRATNYLPLIKKALAESGFSEVPVISVALGSGIKNDQPGFRIDWLKTIPAVLHTLLFTDCLAQFYHATLPREKQQGMAQSLLDKYLQRADTFIRAGENTRLFDLIVTAADDFRQACIEGKSCPCVGIVGEIYLKYNPFAHREIARWLAQRGIETVPSMLTGFFTQYFVNRQARRRAHLEGGLIPERLYTGLYRFIASLQQRADRAAASFPYYRPFGDIFKESAEVEPVITLNAQFGEGWLLPAEIIGYYHRGIRNVISLQPFGCIANHIVSKGLEKKLKELYPELNLLSLDFDSGVSNANIINRLLLFCSTVSA